MSRQTADLFAHTLTEAIYHIRHREQKSVRMVQDELGYALGKKGGASIEHWRKGHVPARLADVERLAREIVARSDLGSGWLLRFLESAGHPDPTAVSLSLFPAHTPPPPAAPLLPVDPTPFVGRETELQQVGDHLLDPACRILTLVGPGGIGKTRLALQAAAAHTAAFPDGLVFVALADLNQPALLLPAIAEALGVAFVHAETAVSELLAFLQPRRLLLILDNFEHLMPGVDLVVRMTQQAPQLKLLVTSRMRLSLRGEWVFPVGGLSLPVGGQSLPVTGQALSADGQADATAAGAVRLFVHSARRARADFTPAADDWPHVARICQLVGGIPLGIELAASWVRLLPCAAIAAELERDDGLLTATWRDVPARHRSLQTVFDTSWALLSPAEQQLVRRLAVFEGGFTREAAVSVAGATLATLSALIDKSFLQQTLPDGRYEMHDLLQRYARARLRAPEAAAEWHAVSAQHCDYYAAYLQQRAPLLTSGASAAQAAALDEIGAEIRNLRAAWECAVAQPRPAAIARQLAPLCTFYDLRGWLREAAAALETAAARLRPLAAAQDVPVFAEVLAWQAHFRLALGERETAAACLHEGLLAARRLQAAPLLPALLVGAAAWLAAAGQPREARCWLARALADPALDHAARQKALRLRQRLNVDTIPPLAAAPPAVELETLLTQLAAVSKGK